MPGDTSWFVKDRLGMFIHWGIYALGARHEWLKNREQMTTEQYQKYFDHFDPDLYDPREWARLAKNAGMKYFVVTTKHHDGFCNFDTKVTDYNIMNTPFGRDITKEITDACHKHGIKIGYYYSQPDWNHPLYAEGKNEQYVKEFLFPQIRELMTNYGKIDIMWFDHVGGRERFFGEDRWAAEAVYVVPVGRVADERGQRIPVVRGRIPELQVRAH